MTRIISVLVVTFAALAFSSCGCKPKLKTPPMQPLPKFQDPRTLDTSVGEPVVVADVEEIEEIPVEEVPIVDEK